MLRHTEPSKIYAENEQKSTVPKPPPCHAPRGKRWRYRRLRRYRTVRRDSVRSYRRNSASPSAHVAQRIAGAVPASSCVTGELLRRIEDLSVPCVILGRSEEVGAEANWVDINNVQAGRRAVRLLLERGYKKIAFLSDGDGEVFNQDRIAGYRRELAANHLSVPDGFILHGLPTVESGMDCVRVLLQDDDAPDAVICSDDRLALGALRAAHQLGLRVPEQFGIISCDNTPLTELAETPITSVDVDTFALGVQAAQILIEQIEDPQTSLRQILLSTKLIERASTMRETREETEAIHI